jgi:uncharacterized pyridoxamine 5'-phosphate oxidase family protein
MTNQHNKLTKEQVWNDLRKELFAVLGMVNAQEEARTVGIVYIVHEQKLYISTRTTEWKTRHVRNNPNVSMTVPIAKRVPFMPWIKIPQATITFSGKARVFAARDVDMEILHALLRGGENDPENLTVLSVLEIEPQGEFITYGIGVPLMQMRYPDKARGRVPVG